MRALTLVCAALVVAAMPQAAALPGVGLPDPDHDLPGVPADPVGDPVAPGDGRPDVDPDDLVGTVHGQLPMDGCRWTGPGSQEMGPVYDLGYEAIGWTNGVSRDAWERATRVFQEPSDNPEVPRPWETDCPLPDDAPKGGAPGSPSPTERTGSKLPTLGSSPPQRSVGQSPGPAVQVTQSDLRPAPAPAPPGLPMLALVGVVAAAAVVVLYRRLRRDEVLDHDLRRDVLDLVKEDPGATVAQVAETFDVHYETARHHLDVLIDFDLVIRTRVGGRVHHFENGGTWSREDRRIVARVRRDPRPGILETLAREGALAAGELAERADLAPSSISYHMDRLVAAGVADREADGRQRWYRLTEPGRRIADALLG